jgi:hypothetical protein
MKRTDLNIIIDLAAAILFSSMIGTGYILHFPLQPGTNKTLLLWSFTRHEWGGFHFWMSIGFLLTILVHVAVHWQWIVNIIAQRYPTKSHIKASLLPGYVRFSILGVLTFGLFAWSTHNGVREIMKPIQDNCSSIIQNTEKSESTADNNREVQARSVFWKDIYPLFEKRCLACHGPLRQAAGFRVDLAGDLFAGKGKSPLILPGKSSESPLIRIISEEKNGTSVRDRHGLPRSELILLKNWIDSGADWPAKAGF